MLAVVTNGWINGFGGQVTVLRSSQDVVNVDIISGHYVELMARMVHREGINHGPSHAEWCDAAKRINGKSIRPFLKTEGTSFVTEGTSFVKDRVISSWRFTYVIQTNMIGISLSKRFAFRTSQGVGSGAVAFFSSIAGRCIDGSTSRDYIITPKKNTNFDPRQPPAVYVNSDNVKDQGKTSFQRKQLSNEMQQFSFNGRPVKVAMGLQQHSSNPLTWRSPIEPVTTKTRMNLLVLVLMAAMGPWLKLSHGFVVVPTTSNSQRNNSFRRETTAKSSKFAQFTNPLKLWAVTMLSLQVQHDVMGRRILFLAPGKSDLRNASRLFSSPPPAGSLDFNEQLVIEGPRLPAIRPSTKRLFLVRHGEVINPGGDRPVYYGAMDVPLSPLGKEEAKAAALYLKGLDEEIDIIVSSPLSRAVFGANEIRNRLSNLVDNHIVTIDGFKELDRGSWCGKTKDEIGSDMMSRFDACDESVTPEGGESFLFLKNRVLAARDVVLDSLATGRAAVVVSHLQVTRSILSDALGIPTEEMASLKVATASVTCIDYDSIDGTQTIHFQSFKPHAGLQASTDGAN